MQTILYGIYNLMILILINLKINSRLIFMKIIFYFEMKTMAEHIIGPGNRCNFKSEFLLRIPILMFF